MTTNPPTETGSDYKNKEEGMKKISREHKWIVSGDELGEDFNYGGFYDAKEQAIEEFRKELASGGYDDIKKRGYFWVGQVLEHSPLLFLSADRLLDTAIDVAGDEGGEFAEPYQDTLSDVSQEAKDELDELILAWVEKHDLEPTFYQIINSEKVAL